ncbi:MAG: PIN/TRAM domain-containing protein [Bacillaceae bacterium]|uniref:PIN/TRAM domain-containing protein n=1 Tax=Alkalihalobacterium chitinilyticum TaxID=2980103 RepID=A0ABT5VJV0_9BACI|nr:PIN/TRAM domain-containing protein [Alkalihalobacterium chitinilyticum]MDE5415733.1 PIN/TRAM domain-containing protein [Alkalihalobacterium chitinilyticum]MEB1809846.1 PIN/TRAM domain-containing protein [Bacillaceae bacterium]
MLKRIVQLFFVLIGGTLGFLFIPEVIEILNFGELPNWVMSSYAGAVFGAIIFYLSTFWLADYIVGLMKLMEEAIVKAPITDVLFGTMGLIVGLIVAYLIGIPIDAIQVPVISSVLPIFITFFLGYFGFQIGFKKRDELINLFSVAQRKDKKKDGDVEKERSGSMKLLDTSVIIDGRIADICKTGFLEGTLIIPEFVLEELQHIADSSDVLKRNRGRRGLDILNKIQKELPIKVEIYEGDFDEIQEVDSKLVKLAKLLSGVVVTNDFNLNKVCELQGVPVLNINDLANAVKPVVLPGEELNVQVIKDGKEHNQGVAYLDDGTMIVVEGGRDYIGKQIDVIVTSVLQTSAGRMIFAKPKLLEKAL